MNILVIHEINWLTKVVFELQTLAELLSLCGHKVYAIDYEYGNPHTKYTLVARAYLMASVRLISPASIKLPVVSRLSAFFTHYYAIEKVIKEKKIDVIILYSVPTNGLQTLHLAYKYHIPVVCRSIDVLHQLVSNPVLSEITYQLEKRVYCKADLILTICPEMSKYVIRMGAIEDKVKLLPLGVDLNTYKPDLDTGELKQKWGIKESDKVIVFVGTLPKFSGLDGFLHQFVWIHRQVPEAKLMIVGDGIHRSQLEGITNKLGLPKQVVFTGFQPYETMSQYINLADVCINSFRAVGATNIIFPTKVIQYLACGKPVLAYPLPGLKSMIQGEAQGVVYVNPYNIVSKTVYLLQSDKTRQQLGENAVNYVKRVHSYDKIIRQLESEIRNLIGSKP